MTGCHYNVDRLSLFTKEGKSQKYIPDFDEGRWNYADRAVSAASEGKN